MEIQKAAALFPTVRGVDPDVPFSMFLKRRNPRDQVVSIGLAFFVKDIPGPKGIVNVGHAQEPTPLASRRKFLNENIFVKLPNADELCPGCNQVCNKN